MAIKLILIAVLSGLVLIGHVFGHGTVIDPVSRSTRWRYNSSATPNWNDNELYCGGYGIQWDLNGGQCGFCGDDYRNPRPRANEHGGTYGDGVIVASYNRGQNIRVQVRLSASHLGYFTFNVCNLDQFGGESDNCFNAVRLQTVNGGDRYNIPVGVTGLFDVDLRLPGHLSCNHCVLQWIYVTGNRWGWCGDGSGALGCGPQEQFRQCSDFRIYNNRAIDNDINENFVDDIPPEIPVEISEPY